MALNCKIKIKYPLFESYFPYITSIYAHKIIQYIDFWTYNYLQKTQIIVNINLNKGGSTP